MRVRLATDRDLPAIVELGRRFHAFSGDTVAYDPNSADATARGLMQMGFILLADAGEGAAGMIGVAVVPLFFNYAEKLAQELMWWVDEDGRSAGTALALLRAAESEARARGACRLQMIALANSPPHVTRLYERLGYQHRETAFSKDL